MNPIKTYLHDGGRVGDGFANEKLDCGVRAYAIAKGIPYYEAHEVFEKAGRLARHRTSWNIYTKIGIQFNQTRMSLKKFLLTHPKGSFYVCMRGHAFAVKDGVVFGNVRLSGRVVVKRWAEII